MSVAWPLTDVSRVDAAAPDGEATRVQPLVRAAVYLFVASIPFEIPGRSIPIEIPTLTGFLLLAATLLQPGACYRRLPAPVLLFTVWLWVFVLSAYVNGVDQRILALRLFLNMTQLIALFLVLCNVMTDPRTLRGVLLTLVVACVVRAGMQAGGVAVSRHAVWTGGERVTVLGQNANLSAMILSAGLVTLVGLRLAADRGVRHLGMLTWPLALLLVTAIVQTGSRGGLLCAGAGLAMFTTRGGTVGRRLRNLTLAVLGLVALGWAASRAEVMRGRFAWATEEGQLAGREAIYPAALAMFRERPLLGWAPIDNQFEIARRIDDLQDPQRDAHNLILELLTATGLIGAVPFLAGVALCLRGAWRARAGRYGALPLAVVVAVLTGTISGTWIAGKIVWLALALGAGTGALVAAGRAEGEPCAV